MQVIPNFNGLSNFVSKINWRYNATNENGITADIEGMTTYNDSNENNYIDYYSLTEDEIIAWLNSQENILDLQYKLDSTINEKLNPVIVTLPLPW
jgi:hypothetical protein